MRRLTVSWLATGALALAPVPAAAQGIAGEVGAFNIQRRSSYQSAVYQQTGVAVAADGAVRVGPVRLRVSGLFGTLKADTGVLNPEVKFRTTAATLEVAVLQWLALGATVEARRFETTAGITMWKFLGATVRLEPPLGLPGLSGLAEGAILPSGSIILPEGSAGTGPKTKVAFQFQVGLAYQLPHSPFQARLGYRFERYDFEASGLSPERYEQFGGIIAEVGLHLGRW